MRLAVTWSGLIAAGLMTFGCSRPNTQILGKWENKERGEIFKFVSDGEFTYTGTGTVHTMLGPYRTKGDQLFLEHATMQESPSPSSTETTALTFSINGNVLVLNGIPYERAAR